MATTLPLTVDASLLESVLDRAAGGERLDSRDALALLESHDLLAIGAAANEVRNRKNDPAVATYSIDRNINYTNVCVYRCQFCAFYRKPGDADAYILSHEEIGRKIEETIAAGGTGILLQGGIHPKLRLPYYEELLGFIRERFPGVHRHALSAPEIVFVAKVSRLSIEETLRRLIAAGLQSVPGGGAEILSEQVRRDIWAQWKASVDEYLAVHREAHRLGRRTTATMMFGVGESLHDRIEHFEHLRALQDETGGFTAFIPWTFQEPNTALEGRYPPSEGFDYLKTLAVSRLYLDNFEHVQGSWVTQGKKIGQMSLKFGADDLGSIMLEENVVAAAGATYRMTQSDMEHVIRGAGYTPIQRRTLYDACPC